MMVEIAAQLLQELIRALLVDELSSRVRKKAETILCSRAEPSARRALGRIQESNRRRVLNRLATRDVEEP